MQLTLTLFAILTQVHAAEEPKIVKYVKNGALITGLGTVTLNNPQPIQFEIDGIDSCKGDLWMCYQHTVTNNLAYEYCDSGFCAISISYEQKAAQDFKSVVDGNDVQFTLREDKKFVCPADTTDGYQKWQFVKIPTGCDLIIVGATDPYPMGKAKLAFYILGGAAAVILFISVGAVVYLCFFRRPEIPKPERRHQSRSIRGNNNVNTIY